MADHTALAVYRHCAERVAGTWPAFAARREARLQQERRFGHAAEKVAEAIVEDLFTGVLDWALGDLNNQVEFADIVLSSSGIRHLIIETKRPGALAWNGPAVERALDQARRYSARQRVRSVAVSDGRMLYAADVADGGLRDRALLDLAGPAVPEELWWLSVHGIYRQRPAGPLGHPGLLSRAAATAPESAPDPGALLHPKYGLPVACFAYVGDAARTTTWKLPYRLADCGVDTRRLPKAVGALLTNYRGARVGGIPEEAVPAVLVRLAEAAPSIGHMGPAVAEPAPVYRELAAALHQIGTP